MVLHSSQVLILETDIQLRDVLVEMLQENGCRVLYADNGKDGVRLLRNDPDLIILSDEMEPVDGVEILPLFRELTRSIIVVVGLGADGRVVSALLKGADMYIRKPINYREMLSRVKSLLGRHGESGNDNRKSTGFISSSFSFLNYQLRFLASYVLQPAR